MTERNDVVQFEEEGNESFYESFDRVLSSCSCSTSNSDYDSDPSIADSTRDPHPFPVLKFPMGISGFDLWKSEPESVSERRTRLLSEMGLCRVPDLAPSSQNGSGSGRREKGSFHFVRLVSSDGLTRKNHRESLAMGNGSVSLASSCAVRLRSRSGVSNNFDRDQLRLRNVSPCSSSSSHVCSPSIRSVCTSVNILNDVVIDCNVDDGGKPCALIDGNCFSVCGAAFENKQPTESIFREIGGNPSLSGNLSCNSAYVNGRDVFLEEQMYTIKDLDNGKEFVVNEVREDGTWEKLKEVGTGRQLTIEEFELCVGTSPIVLELMRRQNAEEGSKEITSLTAGASGNGGTKHRRRGSWLKSIRSVASNVTGYKERRSTDERDSLSERGHRFSSATDDSRDSSFHEPERVKVRQYGKSCKELTALFKGQEIQAHNGSIWSIKFSLDGRYLASAGEDRVIHVWQVVESERRGELLLKEKLEDVSVNMFLLANGSPERTSLSPRRRGRRSFSRKSLSLENIVVPETVFGLLGKPVCSFLGHLDDVLDLSWSKSLHLLSSSMDKTVRLWDLSSKTCLKIFSHSDYVTCIQFNPVDDSFFISGSLDAKVRIWSIPDHQVVDWTDLREMITAACYTPDGQGALVGSYKGTCCLYNILENKFHQKSEINLQNRKKKPHHKKITGFQFVPGSSSEVLITSADSRTRVVDGVDLVHKFKGFRNTNSQISASLTSNGRYLVSASEDSHVYVWNHDSGSRTSRSKRVTVTNSYEHFCCQDVSVAIPWPGKTNHGETSPDESSANHPPTPVEQPCSDANKIISTNGIISNTTNRYFFDRISATWPEEKLILAAKNRTRGDRVSVDSSNGVTNTNSNTSAWSMVIVTGSLRGEIRIFQNFGSPVRL